MKNFVKLFGNINQACSAKVPLLLIAFFAVIVFSMNSCKGKSDSSSRPDLASAADSTSVAPSSINNWDTFIKEYEDFFLNEYVPLLNKIKTGDMSVYAQLEPLQTRFSEWPERMQNFIITAGKPTDAQQRKLKELSERIDATLKE